MLGKFAGVYYDIEIMSDFTLVVRHLVCRLKPFYKIVIIAVYSKNERQICSIFLRSRWNLSTGTRAGFSWRLSLCATAR